MTMMQKVRSLLLALLSTFLLLQLIACEDACSMQTTNMYSFQRVKDCMESVPFNATLRDTTIDTLRKTWQLHVFRDIVRDSPSPNIPMRVDIEKGLEDLSKTEFESDVHFHQSLVQLFRQLKDGHTIYTNPKCYENIVFKQPFSIISYVDTKGQHIGVSSVDVSVANFLQETYGVDVHKYAGAQIVTIDGQDALEFIVNWSNTSVGLYKDLGTRFNLAVSTFFMQRQQQRLDIPDKSNMTFTFQVNGELEQVNVPWIAITQANYSSNAEFKESCLSHAALMTTQNSRRSPPLYIEEEKPMLTQLSTKIPLVNGEKISFYQVNEQVGVMTIADFGPESSQDFARDFQLSLYYAKLYKLTNLIIDLTNNGGGDICLGYSAVKYLFQKDFAEDYSTLYANTDMIYSDLGAALAEAGAKVDINENLWNAKGWRSSSGQVFTDASWFTKGAQYTRGGISGKYSQLIKENVCDQYFNYYNYDEGSLQKYTPDNILLLSNGRCASTCALFSRHLQESRKVKTVVVGGIKDQQQQIAQVPGGQVYELSEILNDLNIYNMTNSPLAPRPLPTLSRFRFAVREAYAWAPAQAGELIPLEFYFEPSDFRLYYTNASAIDQSLVWSDAAQFFSVCKDWESRECTVENGVGTQKCDGSTGKYVNECQVVACNAGYGITDKQCEQCEVGTYQNGTELNCQPCFKPSHSKFVDVKGVTSNSCPFECESGYNLQNGSCVSKHSITLPKLWLVLVSVCAGFFFITTVLLGLSTILAYLRKPTNTEEQQLLR